MKLRIGIRIWLISALFTLLIGTHGALLEQQRSGITSGYAQALLQAFSHFFGDFGDLRSNRSFQSILSCYLALGLTATGLLAGFSKLFRDHLNKRRLLTWKNHTVIVGLDSFGLKCVEKAIREGQHVLGIDRDPAAIAIATDRFSTSRTIFAHADARDPSTLSRLGSINRASRFVVIPHDEIDILDAWLELQESEPSIDSKGVRHAYFNMRSQLAQEALRQACADNEKLVHIDIQRYCPTTRLIHNAFLRYPIDNNFKVHMSGHKTSIGLYATKDNDNLELALSSIAQIAHFASNQKLQVHLWGATEDSLPADSPLSEILDLYWGNTESTSSYQKKMNAFYVVASNARELIVGKKILRELAEEPLSSSVVCLSTFSESLLGHMLPSAIQSSFSPPWISSSPNDELAKQIHELFRKEYPDMPPWSLLPQDKKEDNRSAARHVPVKLRAMGFQFSHNGGNGIDCPPPSEVNMEALASMEHARWSATKRLSGYRLGHEKSATLRTHPSLIPWKDLSKEEKEKDHIMLKNLPEIISQANLKVIPFP